MELFYFLLFFLIWVASEIVVFYFFKKRIRQNRRNVYVWSYWLFTGLILLFFIISFFKIKDGKYVLYNYSVVFLFTHIVCKVLMALTISVGWVSRGIAYRIRNRRAETLESPSGTDKLIPRRLFLRNVVIGAGAIPAAASIYSVAYGAYDFKLRHYRLGFPHFPLAKGAVRICQISDIHAGSLINMKKFRTGIQRMLEQKPDLIFFTGDLVSYASDEVLTIQDELSMIRAPMGVYSVLGNHDYAYYAGWMNEEERRKDTEKLILFQQSLGWKVLMNEKVYLQENFVVAGSENWGDISRFPKKGEIAKTLKGTTSEDFILLLTHDPSFWEKYVLNQKLQVPLTFSGHTHAFQFGFEILGRKWSPSQYLYKRWDGLYREGDQYLYVNRGIGNAGFTGRLGMTPEIAVFDIYRS